MGGGQRVVIKVFQHHDKFVTAEARHGIGRAHTIEQAQADLLQQQIAGFVAAGVIETFEVIKVNEKQGAIMFILGTRDQRMPQTIKQQPAVWQPGQGV